MEPCPTEKEIRDFQFQLFSTIRLFPSVEYQTQFNTPSNIIAASNKHGLLFVGTPTGFQIVNFVKFVSPNSINNVHESIDYPRREYKINAKPTFIALNCDETLLAVVVQTPENVPLLRVYKIASLTQQSKNKVVKVQLNQSGTYVTDFNWNPVIPDLISLCDSNGTLYLYTHDDNGNKIVHLKDKNISCISWSPKGKQLLVGDKFGNIIQYKPDLKEPFKIVPPPVELYPNQCTLISLIWLSVYQYGVVYGNKQTMNTHFSIVNAPKSGPIKYISYDELCFNSGTIRSHQFYFINIPLWNILILSSANSTEVSVLHLLDDKITWEIWIQEDSRRIDLPLDKNKSETYPIGICLATCSQLKIHMNEDQYLEPMPSLTILSNDGLVSMYHVINTVNGVPNMCNIPQPLPDHMFDDKTNIVPSATITIPSPQIQSTNLNSQIGQNISQSASNNQEISIRISQPTTGSPLSLFGNKNQITITPVVSSVPSVSSITNLPMYQKVDPNNCDLTKLESDQNLSLFKAESQLNVIQTGNNSQSVSTNKKEPTEHLPNVIGPTIVINTLSKQTLKQEIKPIVSNSNDQMTSNHISDVKKGIINRDDLKIFFKLEDNINQLLKSYKINFENKELNEKLMIINSKLEKFESFFNQLEESTKSLTIDILHVKQNQNEAFVYTHECKDQLNKYERKKNNQFVSNIMITKKSINPIVEKQLISIENQIRKATFYIRTCIQESRPIFQHLDMIKSGKNILNFQSILQSINKEKVMISKCTIMLDEINRDVMKYYNKNQIQKKHTKPYKDNVELMKTKIELNNKSNDKFQMIKDHIKKKSKMTNEKLAHLKSLHITQVLEPIRYSDIVYNDDNKSKSIRMSDMIKLFKSPQKSLNKSTNESYDNSLEMSPIKLSKEELISTPIQMNKTKSIPSSLFSNEDYGKSIPSPVLCDKPYINENTTAFVIDTSNIKASATKLTFDDSNNISQMPSSVFGKNVFNSKLFTSSTPAISSQISSNKLPSSFGIPVTVTDFGSSFNKSSESNAVSKVSPVSSKSDTNLNKLSVSSAASIGVTPSTGSLFSSDKPVFGFSSSATTTLATTGSPFSIPISSFGTSPKSTPISSVSSSNNLFGTTVVTTTLTSTKSLFAPSVSTFAGTSTTTSFNLTTPSTSVSKTPFGSSNFGTIMSSSSAPTPFSISSVPSFANNSVTSASSPFGVTSSMPSLFSGQPLKATTGTPFSGFSLTSALTKSGDMSTKVPSNQSPFKFEFSTSSSFTAPTVGQKKSTESVAVTKVVKSKEVKSLEETSTDLSLGTLLASSPAISNQELSGEATLPDEIANVDAIKSSISSTPSTSSTSDVVKSLSFGTSVFGNSLKTAPSGFSFVNASSEKQVSSPDSAAPSLTTPSTTSTTVSSSIFTTPKTSTPGAVPTASTTVTATPTTTSNLFANTSSSFPTTPTSSSLNVTPTSKSISFEVSSTTTQLSTPIQNTAAATSVFSTPPNSTVPAVLFPTTPTSSASVFASTTVSSSLVFPSTTAPSPFASSQTEPKTSQAEIGNLFGSSLNFGSASPNASVFGGQSGGNIFNKSSTSFGQTSGNIFAQKPVSETPQTNIFGHNASATSSSTLFGQTPSSTANVFAKSGSVFGGNSSTSVFGQSNTGNTFGNSSFGGFGSNPEKTESSSFFGQNNFGASTTSTASVFGTPTTTTSSVFGQKSPFNQSNNTPAFGGTAAFGAKSSFGQTSGSIFGKTNFGQSGGSIFGSAGGTQNTSGGSIFGGSSSNAFGSSSFGQTPAFGQSPFGTSSSTFGNAPAFGSTPAFGGSPSFGTSPNKIFGATDNANPQQQQQQVTGFGSMATNPNFDNLSFGNLAQQTPQTGFGSFGQTAPSAPTFGAQPSFQSSQGGGSFSSWR